MKLVITLTITICVFVPLGTRAEGLAGSMLVEMPPAEPVDMLMDLPEKLPESTSDTPQIMPYITPPTASRDRFGFPAELHILPVKPIPPSNSDVS